MARIQCRDMAGKLRATPRTSASCRRASPRRRTASRSRSASAICGSRFTERRAPGTAWVLSSQREDSTAFVAGREVVDVATPRRHAARCADAAPALRCAEMQRAARCSIDERAGADQPTRHGHDGTPRAARLAPHVARPRPSRAAARRRRTARPRVSAVRAARRHRDVRRREAGDAGPLASEAEAIFAKVHGATRGASIASGAWALLDRSLPG